MQLAKFVPLFIETEADHGMAKHGIARGIQILNGHADSMPGSFFLHFSSSLCIRSSICPWGKSAESCAAVTLLSRGSSTLSSEAFLP